VFLERSTRPTCIRRARRGFTLIELIVVVVIIGITAALATPQVIQLMRERRGRQAAQSVALVYATARMRAMGRGSAVLVQYRRATGTFTVLESIEGADASNALLGRNQANCANQPGMGCLSTNWAVNSRTVETLVLENTGTNLNFGMFDASGGQPTQFDVCFTPLGRSFSSTTGAPPTAPMTTPSTFRILSGVKSGRTFYTRNVVILPNGTARIAL
jgi:prepilin-type N-terminal cleavage/methylation domain-containing protein